MTDSKILEPDFAGFQAPQSNFCKFPLQIIDELPNITTLSELKVVLYILRHTWGYQEFDEGKKITLDEFEKGRKRRDGSRIDNGTGLSIPSIRAGIIKATEHGYITLETDDSDPARVKNYYALNMESTVKQSEIQGERNLHPECKNVSPGVQESLPRTEKDTIERNLEIEILSAPIVAAPAPEIVQDDISDNELKSSSEKPEKLPAESHDQFMSILSSAFKLHGGRAWDVYHQLRGSIAEKNKKTKRYEYGALFRDKPVTLEELQGFVKWYPAQCKDCDLPIAADVLEDWIGKYRTAKQKPVIDNRLSMLRPPANLDMLQTTKDIGA